MDRISSLMDGELDAHQAEQQLAYLTNDAQARECWDTFHLIGDAMRGEYAVSKRFSGLLHQRLAQEPAVLAPRRVKAARPGP